MLTLVFVVGVDVVIDVGVFCSFCRCFLMLTLVLLSMLVLLWMFCCC